MTTATQTLDPTTVAVGDKVTICYWTDRSAAYVVEVRNHGKTLVLKAAKAELLNGPRSGEPDAMTCSPGGFAAHFDGIQRYEIASYDETLDSPIGKAVYSYRKNGRYVRQGDTANGQRIIPGHHHYHDYNF